jgi:glycolate oxidase iron-sulfur subunit
MLAKTLPSPARFRALLLAARAGRWARFALPSRLRAALELAPEKMPRPQAVGAPGTYPANGARKGRVSLLMGCVQSVMAPEINAATIRLLNRLGYEVVVGGGESCCGSITHHMGLEDDARRRAAAKIHQYTDEAADAIIVTASGCGTTIKDYGHMFRNDPGLAEKARAVSARAMDITEFLIRLNLPKGQGRGRIAYQAACSLQHGQQVKAPPVQLLRQAGFEVVEPADAHLCCGSAGTYNILQPELAGQLKQRKLATLRALEAGAIASGNVGCITQLGREAGVRVLHTVQFLDWAYGGEKPAGLG